MLTAIAKYAKAQEIEPIVLAIPGPIIGKALYYGKCSVPSRKKRCENAPKQAGIVSCRPDIVRRR
jgi:hypothetical protein